MPERQPEKPHGSTREKAAGRERRDARSGRTVSTARSTAEDSREAAAPGEDVRSTAEHRQSTEIPVRHIRAQQGTERSGQNAEAP